jgi:hypothetical protein
MRKIYSLFELASGATIVEDVPGASQAARKPNKPIKITIFFISIFPFRYKFIKIRFS